MNNEKKPWYLQIKDYLLNEIAEKRLTEGDMLPSEKELSEKFQVSRITVRRAFTELEQENIISRYPGKGTFISSKPSVPTVQEKCRQRKEKKQYTIGVIMSHLDSPFQVSLLQSIETAIGKMGYQLMFGLSHGKHRIENELIDRMRAKGVDGLIIYPVDGAFYSERILQMSMEGFPVVLVDRYLPGVNTCSVYSDDRKGGQILGEYLVNKGHKRIALFSQNPENTVCLMNRIEGFRYALLCAGIPYKEEDCMENLINCSVYHDPQQYETNVRIIENFLKTHPDITAVYCTIATFAMNTLWAARNLKKNIEIVCFDNVEPYQWTEKLFIPYISHPESEMGSKAVESLIKLLEGETPQNIIIPCELVENQN